MGLFRKKADPITERARDLDDKIAALQAEIKKLSHQASAPPTAPAAPTGPGPAAAHPKAPGGSNPAANNPPPGQAPPVDRPSAIPRFTNPERPSPRLRSTARPHRPAPTPPPGSLEPVFEQLNQPEIQPDGSLPSPEPEELGTRRDDMSSLWQRFLRHFRGPVTSNPKLVNYLAAGSIQGLQPLRYEKRVARNRFIVFAGLLLLLLWGLIVMLFSRH